MGIDFDIDISDEQACKFAADLYYSSNLIADIKSCIKDNAGAYAEFLKEEGVST